MINQLKTHTFGNKFQKIFCCFFTFSPLTKGTPFMSMFSYCKQNKSRIFFFFLTTYIKVKDLGTTALPKKGTQQTNMTIEFCYIVHIPSN